MSDRIEITDFSAPQLDIYARLPENQLLHYYEPEQGIFIAESPKVIGRALDAGCEPVSVLVEKRQTDEETEEIGDFQTDRFLPDPRTSLCHAPSRTSFCLSGLWGSLQDCCAGAGDESHQCRGDFPFGCGA